MTTSIKEALELKPCPFCGTAPAFGRMIEPDQVTIGCNNDGCLVQLCVVSDVESEAVKAWNTRATFQPDGERWEAIARIICYWDEPSTCHDNYCVFSCRAKTPDARFFKAADAILSSGLVQNEAGIRRDEREKCAKICDALGDEVMERAEEAHENEEYDEYESLECAATEYNRAASAIRSARNGGAS